MFPLRYPVVVCFEELILNDLRHLVIILPEGFVRIEFFGEREALEEDCEDGHSQRMQVCQSDRILILSINFRTVVGRSPCEGLKHSGDLF